MQPQATGKPAPGSRPGGPGWMACCPACGACFPLEDLGGRRKGAYSSGKRLLLPCPGCGRPRWMRVLLLDAQGRPDQRSVRAWLIVLLVLAAAAVALAVLFLAAGLLPRACWSPSSLPGTDVECSRCGACCGRSCPPAPG